MKPGSLDASYETIDIWNGEPYHIIDTPPKWTCHLEFKDGTRELSTPIIHPSHYDWRIRWRAGDTIIVDEKVKRFADEQIQFGKFVFIRILPEYSIEQAKQQKPR